MKNLLRLILGLVALASSLRADPPALTPDAATVAALEAADKARVAAILAGDRAGLTEIFSDDLYFRHASGALDSKASYTEKLATKQTVYSKYTYQNKVFRQLAPGIVQMSGRLLLDTRTGTLDLNFTSVWRNENGKWRFLVWQSATNPPPAAKK
jgi:hypothetical protein